MPVHYAMQSSSGGKKIIVPHPHLPQRIWTNRLGKSVAANACRNSPPPTP